ncbi:MULTISPECIES: hypothetical protein [unclassified Streptomyces]|uniref:hypothetical protein n=1 Tax=unclassified Streptomyces TaxID=2593676 RepID=UPI00093FEB3D|nr:hypothetical protein [Streptomyces sp. TSRI0107]OKJ77379.1 hypothetical protein AMK31_28565 [Streptomyces sp. TSRI0107]
MTGTRVELRIRRLELEPDAHVGLSPTALCAAVEAELAVLLGLDGTSAGARTAAPAPVPTAAPPAVRTVPANPHAAVLARHIARAVYDAALRAREMEGGGAAS